MAYDEVLAGRVRRLLAGETGVTERRMFGGLAFLVDGRMALAASRDGVMVRADPATAEEVTDGRDVVPAQMRGRELQGWLRVPGRLVETDEALGAWVTRAVGFTRSLPPG